MDTPSQQDRVVDRQPAQPQATRRREALLGFAFIVLAAASLVAWYLQASPLTVARLYVSDQQGIAPDQLEVVGHDSFHPVLGIIMSFTTVELRVKGDAHSQKRKVELLRPVYFLPWYVSALREVKE